MRSFEYSIQFCIKHMKNSVKKTIHIEFIAKRPDLVLSVVYKSMLGCKAWNRIQVSMKIFTPQK